LLLGVMTIAASFCRSRLPPEGQCVFNSDCDDNKVCAGRYCRTSCNSRPNATQAERDRDCGDVTLFTCRRADDGINYACYRRGEPYRCVYHSECNQSRNEICARDGFCRSQCLEDYDCVTLTGNRSSMCIDRMGALGGVCDFRRDDAGMIDNDASSTDAGSVE
jgi:hypothetical protein